MRTGALQFAPGFCSRLLTKFLPEGNPEMRRRDLLKGAVLLPAFARAGGSTPLGQSCDLNFGPAVTERLNQGPFDIDQDQGWQPCCLRRHPSGLSGILDLDWSATAGRKVGRRWPRGPDGKQWSSTWRRSPACHSWMFSTFAAIGATCNLALDGSISIRFGR